MKLIFLITIITLISISKESTVINFEFPRTLYVKDDSKKKVIKISSKDIEKDDSREIKFIYQI